MLSWVHVTLEAIDPTAIDRHLEDPASGGRVLFEGVVRDRHHDRQVLALEYEAYAEMAGEQLRAIAATMTARWPIRRVAIVHRIGRLLVGETAVVVGVASLHRAEAFEACRYGIDAVKRDVPIWKHEHYADGTSRWQENDC